MLPGDLCSGGCCEGGGSSAEGAFLAGELRHSVQGFWFKFQKGFEHCVEEEDQILITAKGALFVVGPSLPGTSTVRISWTAEMRVSLVVGTEDVVSLHCNKPSSLVIMHKIKCLI